MRLALGGDPFPLLGSAHRTARKRRRCRDLITAAVAATIARRRLSHCALWPARMPPSRAPARSSPAAARSRSSTRRKRFLMMFPSVGPQEKKNAGSCEGKPRERFKRQLPPSRGRQTACTCTPCSRTSRCSRRVGAGDAPLLGRRRSSRLSRSRSRLQRSAPASTRRLRARPQGETSRDACAAGRTPPG